MARRKRQENNTIEYRLVIRVDADAVLSEEERTALKTLTSGFLESLEDIEEWPIKTQLKVISSKLLRIDDSRPLEVER